MQFCLLPAQKYSVSSSKKEKKRECLGLLLIINVKKNPKEKISKIHIWLLVFI